MRWNICKLQPIPKYMVQAHSVLAIVDPLSQHKHMNGDYLTPPWKVSHSRDWSLDHSQMFTLEKEGKI